MIGRYFMAAIPSLKWSERNAWVATTDPSIDWLESARWAESTNRLPRISRKIPTNLRFLPAQVRRRRYGKASERQQYLACAWGWARGLSRRKGTSNRADDEQADAHLGTEPASVRATSA